MVRLNIFKNPTIESYVSHYRILHEENIRKETEEFWRNRIALEFYENFIEKYVDKSLENQDSQEYANIVGILLDAMDGVRNGFK